MGHVRGCAFHQLPNEYPLSVAEGFNAVEVSEGPIRPDIVLTLYPTGTPPSMEVGTPVAGSNRMVEVTYSLCQSLYTVDIHPSGTE